MNRTFGHLVALDVVRQLHPLFCEPEEFLLVFQVQALALGQTLRAEEPLLLANEQAQLLNLLQLALLQVLLARPLAQVRHGGNAGGLVLGQLALLFRSSLGRLLTLVATLCTRNRSRA